MLLLSLPQTFRQWHRLGAPLQVTGQGVDGSGCRSGISDPWALKDHAKQIRIDWDMVKTVLWVYLHHFSSILDVFGLILKGNPSRVGVRVVPTTPWGTPALFPTDIGLDWSKLGNAMGMRNLRVNVTGCSGVRVRVAKFVPSENPYLCHGLTGVQTPLKTTSTLGFHHLSSTPLLPKTMFSTPGHRHTKVCPQLFI